MDSKLADKRRRLEDALRRSRPLAVAFSGGVDSSLLVAAAVEALGDAVTAFTVHAPIHSRREVAQAVDTAARLGVRHVVVPFDGMDAPEFVANPPNRCYVCKKIVFGEIRRRAAALGLPHLAHGVNLDDLEDYRPGLKAAEEMGVLAPLVEAGLTKADIRALSRAMGLPTWDRPSMACLASRIPYGRPITAAVLQMVETAEEALQDMGFAGCRVRHHGEIARIEVAGCDVERLAREDTRQAVVARLRAIGFTHVALDLEGYTQGSLNRVLEL
ncbi:MAG TPA: ATP-dependent sacrificial sulfur transferase LarE [Desulfobacterales bacterium]|nr:ATP-dependent sacrificial sulfur transferase LarE [Desulfobacterales bacterium]